MGHIYRKIWGDNALGDLSLPNAETRSRLVPEVLLGMREQEGRFDDIASRGFLRTGVGPPCARATPQAFGNFSSSAKVLSN